MVKAGTQVIVAEDAQVEAKTSGKIATPIAIPWAIHNQKDGSNIDAYIDAIGEWATIARTMPVEGVNPQEVAEQIIHAVNNYEKQEAMLGEMVMTMKLFLECDGISWEAEHDADILLRRYESMKK